MNDKVCMEVSSKDVLQEIGSLEFIVSLMDGDRPLVEFLIALRCNELLDQFILPVTQQPFVFYLKHEVGESHDNEAVTVRFNPGLHEFGLKGIDYVSNLVFSRDFFVSEKMFAGIVKFVEVGNCNGSGR